LDWIAQPDAGAAPVLIDELDAGGFESPLDHVERGPTWRVRAALELARGDDADRPGTSERSLPKGNGSDVGRANGKDVVLGTFSATRKRWSPPKQVLEPGESAALRDQLVQELAGLPSAEEATDWAQRALGAKNTLRSADAAVVEVRVAAGRINERWFGRSPPALNTRGNGRDAGPRRAIGRTPGQR
jgi:hypothetical protein